MSKHLLFKIFVSLILSSWSPQTSGSATRTQTVNWRGWILMPIDHLSNICFKNYLNCHRKHLVLPPSLWNGNQTAKHISKWFELPRNCKKIYSRWEVTILKTLSPGLRNSGIVWKKSPRLCIQPTNCPESHSPMFRMKCCSRNMFTNVPK